ncbi:WAT1-related protein At1g68170-like [Arachis stenosperma]|uniref:WAT1-related protein At1g68170-like n=1 Tax=Arachis stenosperma TaxID=217475 RepID=UPI0025AC4606|nr:WAT1-related protein At1g68170-like [Arachis stenosperma]
MESHAGKGVLHNQWKLDWNIRLLASAYSGIVGSGVVFLIIAWCIQMRGPLLAFIFNPVMLMLVAVVASFMLDEKLYLGSVIGVVLIVYGLLPYMILWGKNKEMKKITQYCHLKLYNYNSRINNRLYKS